MFAEHTVVNFVGVGDAVCHIAHNAGNLFQIVNQMKVGGFDFFHGAVDNLDVFPNLRGVGSDFRHTAAGLCYLGKGKLD